LTVLQAKKDWKLAVTMEEDAMMHTGHEIALVKDVVLSHCVFISHGLPWQGPARQPMAWYN